MVTATNEDDEHMEFFEDAVIHDRPALTMSLTAFRFGGISG